MYDHHQQMYMMLYIKKKPSLKKELSSMVQETQPGDKQTDKRTDGKFGETDRSKYSSWSSFSYCIRSAPYHHNTATCKISA